MQLYFFAYKDGRIFPQRLPDDRIEVVLPDHIVTRIRIQPQIAHDHLNVLPDPADLLLQLRTVLRRKLSALLLRALQNQLCRRNRRLDLVRPHAVIFHHVPVAVLLLPAQPLLFCKFHPKQLLILRLQIILRLRQAIQRYQSLPVKRFQRTRTLPKAHKIFQ